MRRIFQLFTVFTIGLALSTSVMAGDKNKQKIVNQAVMPSPDLRMPALKPQKPLAPVPEVGAMKQAAVAPQHPVVAAGNHKTSSKGGIDISHYQGRIDWSAVAQDSHVSYVFCKATESNGMVDNTFQYNVREARANKIPVGCYHFFNPNVSGEAQLKHFINNVDMSQMDVLPMLDLEVRGKAPLADYIAQIRAWLVGFEAHYHFKPIIYASVNYYNKYLAGYFDEYKYMIAKYGEGTPNPVGNCRFAMWQYSANGRINGIRGAVDMSCFIDNYDVKDILIKNNK